MPHQRAKNQSFLFVPFQFNHSKTMPSMNKSKESSKKTQTPKKEKNGKSSFSFSFYIALVSTYKSSNLCFSSSVSKDVASAAFKLSFNCSRLEAPKITVDTFLLYQIHKNKNNHHRDEEVNYFVFIHGLILPLFFEIV